MTSVYPPKPLSSLYLKVKDEIKFYQNISCILDKNEQDGNVVLLGKTFESIFQKEIVYAVSGEFKRIEEIKRAYPLTRSQKPFFQEYSYFQGKSEDHHECDKLSKKLRRFGRRRFEVRKYRKRYRMRSIRFIKGTSKPSKNQMKNSSTTLGPIRWKIQS